MSKEIEEHGGQWPQGWRSVAREALPDLPQAQVPQGFVAAPLPSGLRDLLSRAQLLPVGLGEVFAERGWELERVAGQPNVVRVAHQEPAPLELLEGTPAERAAQCSDGGLLLDLAQGGLGVALHGAAQALWLAVEQGALTATLLEDSEAHAPLELPADVQCPVDPSGWLNASGDAWLAGYVQRVAADGRIIADWQALAMAWRWQEPSAQVEPAQTLERAVKAWASTSPPPGLERLIRGAVILVEDWIRDGQELLDEPEADDAWWQGQLGHLFVRRDVLEGLATLAGLSGADGGLAEELRQADGELSGPLALLWEGVPGDDEPARRAWLAEPWTWWARLLERQWVDEPN